MIKLKNSWQLEKMRASGQMAALVLDAVCKAVAPGVTTRELDDHAADVIRGLGGKSAFLGYRGYPGHICVSINEEVVHGIPGPRRVRAGDVVSVDVGVVYEGYVGDTARTVLVAVDDPELIRLVNITAEALNAAIRKAVIGGMLSDISHAVEQVVAAAGFSVVRDFVGHGVGQKMHEDPQIPNFGPPGKGPRLKSGMTLAIEPMVNAGSYEVEVLGDGWTVVTKDRRVSAHFEHSVAVGEKCGEILTCLPAK